VSENPYQSPAEPAADADTSRKATGLVVRIVGWAVLSILGLIFVGCLAAFIIGVMGFNTRTSP
jgi:hypothetical protein